MNLFIYTGASRLNAAVVESATDLTAVSRLPDLIVGDSEPVTVKFLSASGAYESWSGGGTYTLSISIGALSGDGIAAYFQTSSFTTVTNGWTGRLNLASGSLPSVVAGYLAERPGAQSVPLFVQVRVTDASGYTETYARQAVSISGAVSVPTTANSTPVTYATAADVAADAATASAAAIAAAASASAASGSASTAAGYVTTAGNSATAAAASAVTAGNSATTASGHATTATTQATNAATSSSNASTYKDAAAVSAASATSSAGTATTQAAAASASATAAGISAAAALVSEAAALVSKNAAAASAATASAVVGSGNGTFSAAALTGVNSITASASTALTLTGGSTGASLVLGQGATAANATILPKGTGSIGLATSSATLYGKVAVALATATSPATVNTSGFDGTYVTFGGVTNSGYSTFGIGVTAAGTTGTNLISAAPGNDWLDINYYGLGHKFYSFGAEKSRLTSTGNLLIGTTTDAASLAGGLVVNGSGAGAAASSTTTGALRVTGGVGVSGAGYFGGNLYTTSTTPLVGIGVTNPLAAIPFNQGGSGMEIKGTGPTSLAISGTIPYLWFYRTGAGADQKSYALAAGASSLALTSLTDAGSTRRTFLDANTNTGLVTLGEATSGVNIPSTTAATSSTVGALTVGNGAAATNVAIGAGRIYTGSDITAGGAITANNQIITTGASAGFRIDRRDTSVAAWQLYSLAGNLSIYDHTSGGDKVTIAATTGNVALASSTASTGVGTGSLQTAGGIYAGAASVFAGAVTIAGTVIHTLSATPASASATGTVGTMSWDANYIYICTATNTWKRVAIATW